MQFLCDLPWVHFSIFPHGSTSVCCETEHRKATGHGYNIDERGKKNILGVKNYSIEQIINSDNYKRIRKEMLQGKVPDACMGCKKIEDSGGRSKRIRDSIWKDDWQAVTKADGTIKPNLRSIELRLGNHCNLRCRSCNAESSTKWIKEYDLLKDKLPLASNYDNIRAEDRYSFDWVDSDDFYQDILEHTGDLRELHISGGEPFLIPRHFKFLQGLLDKGKTDINIGYHTNLNYDLDKIKPGLEILSKFNGVRFNLSLDDVDQRNAYIRNPANWELSIKNIRLFQERYPNIKLLICQTINVYNFLYAEELWQWLQDNDIDLYHYYNHVHSPDYQTAYIIPSEMRKQKLDSLSVTLPEHMHTDLLGRYHNELEYETARDTFVHFTKALDDTRREDCASVFPKLEFLF